MKTLIQGMLSRVRSSRKLSAATRESFVFMYLAEKVNPDFRTIARFRKENAAFVKAAFKKTVERWIKQLKEEGKIEFRGSPKKGGYLVIRN